MRQRGTSSLPPHATFGHTPYCPRPSHFRSCSHATANARTTAVALPRLSGSSHFGIHFPIAFVLHRIAMPNPQSSRYRHACICLACHLEMEYELRRSLERCSRCDSQRAVGKAHSQSMPICEGGWLGRNFLTLDSLERAQRALVRGARVVRVHRGLRGVEHCRIEASGRCADAVVRERPPVQRITWMIDCKDGKAGFQAGNIRARWRASGRRGARTSIRWSRPGSGLCSRRFHVGSSRWLS